MIPTKFPPIVINCIFWQGDTVTMFSSMLHGSVSNESKQVKAFILDTSKVKSEIHMLCNADLVTEQTIVLGTVKYKGHERPVREITMSSRIASSFLLS